MEQYDNGPGWDAGLFLTLKFPESPQEESIFFQIQKPPLKRLEESERVRVSRFFINRRSMIMKELVMASSPATSTGILSDSTSNNKS
jgi:hypothetical protein